MLTRRDALLIASLCEACSSLSGRSQGDASFDGSDAYVDASQTEDRAAPADRVSPASDASTCPRGTSPVIDSRAFGIIMEPAPHPFSSAIVRSAAIDAQGRVYGVGYVEYPPGSRRSRASVWRFRATNLTLDETWGEGGISMDSDASATGLYWLAATIDASGRLVAAGVAGDDVRASALIVRYTEDGRPDATFGAGGRTLVPPSRLRGSVSAVRPFGIHQDADGIIVAAGDGSPPSGPSRRGIALRLSPDGALVESFGTSGAFTTSTLYGCFDVERDGDAYVFACISEDDRPALLRLDARGEPVTTFGADGVSIHEMAPRGFQTRALERDSAGRWLVGGAVSPFYDDTSSAPAAVRFLADGTPDETWGDRGVASAPGVRQTFAYAFAQSFRVTCDDRLMFGAAAGVLALIGGFDREGHRMVSFGEDGYIRGPTSPGTDVAVIALLAVPGSADLVMVGSLSGPGAAFARVLQ